MFMGLLPLFFTPSKIRQRTPPIIMFSSVAAVTKFFLKFLKSSSYGIKTKWCYLVHLVTSTTNMDGPKAERKHCGCPNHTFEFTCTRYEFAEGRKEQDIDVTLTIEQLLTRAKLQQCYIDWHAWARGTLASKRTPPNHWSTGLVFVSWKEWLEYGLCRLVVLVKSRFAGECIK